MRTALLIIMFVIWMLLNLVAFIEHSVYNQEMSVYSSYLLITLLIIIFKLNDK